MLEFLKTEVLERLDKISDGHAIAIIIAAAAVIAVHIIICAIMAASAKRKGHSTFGFFILCLLTGAVGCCITASLSDIKMYELIYEVMDRLDEAEGVEYTDKVIAQTNDERAPEGVIAYIPTPKSSDTTAQEAAADRIEQFWNKNGEKSGNTDFTDIRGKKKAESKQKRAEKRENEVQSAELKRLNKKRNKRKEAQRQREKEQYKDSFDATDAQ